LITEKVIQCYNLFAVKYREKYYNIIENHPDQAGKIKSNMILHNIYALRMNIDLGFKQFMMKLLNQAFQNKINKNSFKKLLSSILDELERPPEPFFNVFNSNSEIKFDINIELIKKYRKGLYNVQNLTQSYYDVQEEDVKFLRELLNTTEDNTSLYRALEDYIVEFESGKFNSRYFKKGEVRRFLLYNFNKYIINLLEHRYSNLIPGLTFNLPLLRLIPEFYLNLSRISELLYETLNELFDLPEDLTVSSFSMLSIHFMSVFMTLIFEEFSYEKKLESLNKFYEYKIESNDIAIIAKNFGYYKNTALNIEEIKTFTENIEIEESGKYLLMLAHEMFIFGLHDFSIYIYEYLYGSEKNEFYKAVFLDNIATAYRDLGQFSKAIELYENILGYYKENELNYRYFLAKKNIAYCHFQMGNNKPASNIFNELEGDFSNYNKEELSLVYYNLAFRYRLIFQFQKEEHYLNLLLENLDRNDSRYLEILNRTLEIGEHFNPSIGKLDINDLKKREEKRTYQDNLRRAYTYLNNYNLKLGKTFLNRAYKNKNFDSEYWRFLSNIFVLKEEWDKLDSSSEEILKFNTHNFFGHFYKCLYSIHKKDNAKLLFHLLEIESAADSFLYSNSLTYERMSNTLHFICRSYSKEEVKSFIDFAFSEFESASEQNYSIIRLMLFFAVIFSFNREKLHSGHIYKSYMNIEKSKETYTLYAGWCYRFNDYTNSKHFYKKALSISPEDIEILERLSRVCLMLDDFTESLYYIETILNIIRQELKEPFEKLKEHILLIRDERIRYENLPFNDVKTIFNTVEYQLKELDPNTDIEFGIILTQISKGIENLFAKTLGKKMYEFIKKKHFPIPQIFKYGNNRDIKPLHVLLLNFFDKPSTHNPTLGNWNYIIKNTFEYLDPQNPVMQNIYDFFSNPSNFNEEMLKLILNITIVLIDERNLATHKKLYSKEEVEKILKKLIPLINEFINYISQ